MQFSKYRKYAFVYIYKSVYIFHDANAERRSLLALQ